MSRDQTLPLGFPTATWFYAGLEVDLEKDILTATANEQRHVLPIDPGWPSTPTAYKVGVPYIGGGGNAPTSRWDVRFDDVRLGVAR